MCLGLADDEMYSFSLSELEDVPLGPTNALDLATKDLNMGSTAVPTGLPSIQQAANAPNNVFQFDIPDDIQELRPNPGGLDFKAIISAYDEDSFLGFSADQDFDFNANDGPTEGILSVNLAPSTQVHEVPTNTLRLGDRKDLAGTGHDGDNDDDAILGVQVGDNIAAYHLQGISRIGSPLGATGAWTVPAKDHGNCYGNGICLG